MKIREIENYGLKILNEKAKDGSMTVYAKFGEAEKRNQNSRIYPREIMTREVDRLQSKINAGQFLGSQDHSDSPATFLKDVSHVVTGLEMKGNEGYATIKILNTDAGRNCQEIIKGKGKIGISTRSVGTVSATGIVQKDLRLLALDLVANPSVKDATIGKENILEGLNFEEEANEILEKEIQALEKESFLGAVEGGYKGSQIDWEKQYGNSLREAMGLPKAEGRETPVEKLTEGQISARTYSYFCEARASGFMGDYITWKKEFPQLCEQAKVKVVAEKKVESKEPFKARMSLAEAHQSGFVGTIAEFHKQHPDIELILPATPSQKVAAEKILDEEALRQEAGRIFTALAKENPNSQLTLESVIKMLKIEEEKKVDIRIKRKAIAIVSRDMFNSGGNVSEEKLEKMIKVEVERLQEERKLRRESNWRCYKRLLSD